MAHRAFSINSILCTCRSGSLGGAASANCCWVGREGVSLWQLLLYSLVQCSQNCYGLLHNGLPLGKICSGFGRGKIPINSIEGRQDIFKQIPMWFPLWNPCVYKALLPAVLRTILLIHFKYWMQILRENKNKIDYFWLRLHTLVLESL